MAESEPPPYTFKKREPKTIRADVQSLQKMAQRFSMKEDTYRRQLGFEEAARRAHGVAWILSDAIEVMQKGLDLSGGVNPDGTPFMGKRFGEEFDEEWARIRKDADAEGEE